MFGSVIISYSVIRNSSLWISYLAFVGKTSVIAIVWRISCDAMKLQVICLLMYLHSTGLLSVYLLMEVDSYSYVEIYFYYCTVWSWSVLFQNSRGAVGWVGGLSFWIREWWRFFYLFLAPSTSDFMVLLSVSIYSYPILSCCFNGSSAFCNLFALFMISCWTPWLSIDFSWSFTRFPSWSTRALADGFWVSGSQWITMFWVYFLYRDLPFSAQ